MNRIGLPAFVRSEAKYDYQQGSPERVKGENYAKA
jgi:hypothetical protein